MTWQAREFTLAEAAQLAGLTLGHLRVILHRNKTLVPFFSEKRRGRRWFSIRDIAIVRLAHVLERFGRTYLFAFADALDLLRLPPPADAVLKVTLGRSLPVPRGMAEPGPVDEPTLFVPIGRIVQDIKDAANVALLP